MSKYLSIGLTIVIFLAFGYILLQNTQNTPSFDDYDTTVNFIRRFYFDNNSIGIKKDILLSRHNEHRILFSKSLAAAYYYFFHQINFRDLVLVQNLFLFAFFVLLLVLMKQKKFLFPETVLWVSLFLFSLAFWQVTFYYWGGIQHYTVFFFSFLSLYMLDKTAELRGPHFFIAVIAVAIAVLSFGNGFIALFLGGFILSVKRKWILLSVWGLISLVLLGVTFFIKPPIGDASHAAFNVEWMARLLFTFLGSFVYINPGQGQYINILICMFVGLAVLVTWIWLFFKGYAFKNPLLYCLFSMPVLTGIIVAISRFETKAAGGIAPRYMFFTATIPVFLILILMDLKLVRMVHLRFLVSFGMLIWAGSFYNNLKELRKTNGEIITTLHKWEKDHNTPLISGSKAKEFSEILTWAIGHKVVCIPKDGTISR